MPDKPKTYSEAQIRDRHRRKSQSVEALRKNIGALRKKLQKDLKSKDEKTKVTALIISLIDNTYERVGNRESEKKRGHFGVTGWQKQHLRVEGDKAVFRYTGKSGVPQEKVIGDKGLVRMIKDCARGKSKGDPLFTYTYGGKGDAKQCLLDSAGVAKYLEEFGVTAKDLRGFHANDEMRAELTRLGPAKKTMTPDERDAYLSEKFKETLTTVAEKLGHQPETLRNQYLVPGFEDYYLKHGKPMTIFHKKHAQLQKIAQNVARLSYQRKNAAPPPHSLDDFHKGDLVYDKRHNPRIYEVAEILHAPQKLRLMDVDTHAHRDVPAGDIYENIRKIPAYMAPRVLRTEVASVPRAKVSSALGGLISQIRDQLGQLGGRDNTSPELLGDIKAAVDDLDELLYKAGF